MAVSMLVSAGTTHDICGHLDELNSHHRRVEAKACAALRLDDIMSRESNATHPCTER